MFIICINISKKKKEKDDTLLKWFSNIISVDSIERRDTTTQRMTHNQPAPSHHEDALPGHPANGQHGSALDPVVVAGVQVAAHAEVGDLDVTPAALLLSAVAPLAAHQAVASRQVAVHKVEGG